MLAKIQHPPKIVNGVTLPHILTQVKKPRQIYLEFSPGFNKVGQVITIIT